MAPLSRGLTRRDYFGRSLGQLLSEEDERLGCLGDSIDAGTAYGSAYNSLIYKYGDRYKSLGNFAVGGETTTQMLGRLPSLYNSGARQAIIGGGTNDIGIALDPPAVTKGNLEYIWKDLNGRGIAVIDQSVLPVADDASNRRDKHIEHNIWRKLRCKQLGIRHVDRYTPLVQTSGTFQAGYYGDGLHPNADAIAVLTKLLDDALQTAGPRSAPLLAMRDEFAHATRPVQNAISLAAAGTPGVPAGWYAANTTGLTPTIQAADANDLGAWWRGVLSSGTNVTLSTTERTLASLGWNIGDKLFVGMKLRWTGALTVSVGFGGITVDNYPMFQFPSPTTGEIMCLQRECKILTGTDLSLRLIVSGTGQIEMNKPILVNMTQLGL